MHEFNFSKPLFGDKIQITLLGIAPGMAEHICEAAYYESLKLEKIFNFYDPSSELSKLNKKRKARVSKELLEVIEKAIPLCAKTNGRYDITKGAQIMQNKLGNTNPLTISCSYKDIVIKENLISFKNKDVMIDLGSIAKGYIVDKVCDFLISQGVESGIVNGRGDLRCFGDKEFLIQIQHPREKTKHFCTIKLKDSAVATSGDYNQYHGNFENTHILNRKDLASVTVVSKKLIDADSHATAIFVVDKNERITLSRNNKDITALGIRLSLKAEYYNGFERLLVDKT